MSEHSSFFRNKYVRIIAGIMAIVWMCIIFSYSSDTAEESSEVSVSTSYQVVSAFNRIMNCGWSDDDIDRYALGIEWVVRKAAHVTEYAILVTLIGIAIDAWYITPCLRELIAILLCTVYASSDEFHQTFIDGRSGSVRDVIIDTFGAALMMGIITLVVYMYRKRRK